MAINIADSFNRTTAQPPFAGVVFTDLTARDAYATTLRYEGMECYVVSEGLYYSLVGGTANGNWTERAGGSGSGVVVVADIAARNAIPELERTNGMLVQVISEDQIYKLIGLPLGATTTDTDWDAVITSKAAQIITAKDIDGGTASNTSRHTTPKDDIEALHLLNRKEGTQLFDTYTKSLIIDDGTKLKAVPKFEKLDVFFQDRVQLEKLSDWTQNLSGITSSFTKVANNPELGDAYLLDITSSTGDAGGAYTLRKDIAVPERFRNQTVSISMDYVSDINTGGANLMIVDQTNSVNLVAEDNVQSPIAPMAVKAKKIVTFQVPATCATLRLFIGKTTTNTTAISNKKISFNNIELGLMVNNIVDLDNANIGDIKLFAGATLPDDTWLFCNGGERPRSEELFGVIGTTYGSGNGSTTYNLPDFRGISPRGVGSQTYNSVTYTSTLGQKRNDAIQNITGTWQGGNGGGLVATGATQVTSGGATDPQGTGRNNGQFTFDASRVVRTDTQTHGADLAVNFIIKYRKKSPNIIQDIETFDSSRNPLVWSGTAITAASPIGTYNTYTKATNSNTFTLAATRPTQTDADILANGFRLYTAAYNAAGAAGTPVRFEVMIGKGFKGNGANFLNFFKDINKQIMGSLDASEDGAFKLGAYIKSYNPIKGTLMICASQTLNSTNTSSRFIFDDGTFGTDGYLTISASKNPALAGLNAPARQIVKTYSSGLSWWEIYSDGWVRQGKGSNSAGTSTVTAYTHEIAMKDTNYTVYGTRISSSTGAATQRGVAMINSSITVNGFNIYISTADDGYRMQVEGYASSAALAALGVYVNY